MPSTMHTNRCAHGATHTARTHVHGATHTSTYVCTQGRAHRHTRTGLCPVLAAVPVAAPALLAPGGGTARPRCPAPRDELRLVVHEHPGQGQPDAQVAEPAQVAAEEQAGEQEVAHHGEVAQEVDGEGGGEGEDAEAGQVVEDGAKAAEQDAAPEGAVVAQDALPGWGHLQRHSRPEQEPEAGQGSEAEQGDSVQPVLLQQQAWGQGGGQSAGAPCPVLKEIPIEIPKTAAKGDVGSSPICRDGEKGAAPVPAEAAHRVLGCPPARGPQGRHSTCPALVLTPVPDPAVPA